MASSINASTSGGGGVIVSSDATGNLNIQSGGSTVVAVTSTGVAVTGTLSSSGASTLTGAITATAGINTPNTFGFKNRIINGGMVIDQRNAGASVTPVSGLYTLDRWQAFQSVASKFSVQQNAGAVTPPVGFSNYLGATSLSAYAVLAGDYYLLRQNIEGFNFADMAWGTANASTITLSFRVYSSLTGTFGGAIQDSTNTRSYPFSYSIPVANTWTTISITIAGDTTGTWIGATNGIGVCVTFGLGVGTTSSGTAGAWVGSNFYSATGAVSVVGTNGATFYITGVQLEKGSTATSFDFRPYGTELALCQRYYEKSFPIGTTVGTAGWVGAVRLHVAGGTGTSTDGDDSYGVSFKVTKRTAPSVATYSPTAVSQVRYYRTGGTNTDGSASVGGTFDSGFYVTASYAGSGSATNVRALYLDFVADSEL
jgi:hypothetical protein